MRAVVYFSAEKLDGGIKTGCKLVRNMKEFWRAIRKYHFKSVTIESIVER